MIHQSHPWAYIWRKTYFEIIHAPQCSLQHYLQKPRHGVNLNTYWQMSRWRRCGTYDNGMLLNLKNKGNNVISSNMDGHRDYHSKWSQRQKSYDINSMWNLKSDTNELIYKTETDSKLWLPKGKGGGRDKLEGGNNLHTLLYKNR